MKKFCDICGKPACVFYQITVNGTSEEKSLCADCAQKEGVSEKVLQPFAGALRFPEELVRAFGDFPEPDSLFESDFFALPRVALPENEKNENEAQTSVKHDASDAEIKPAPPSLATLKARLKRAVRCEDYLKAAALRDQIRAMEGR